MFGVWFDLHAKRVAVLFDIRLTVSYDKCSNV
jgi:hypothetical protein